MTKQVPRVEELGAGFTPRLWWTLILLAAAVALDVGSVAVVNPALPDIGRDLRMDDALLQWTMTGYGITFAGCLLFGGRLADVFSRRLVLAAGIGVFAVGALAPVVVPTAEVLIAARAAQGMGAALSVPAAMALLFQVFPPGRLRNRALGIYTAVGAASFGVGLVLGGVLTSAFGWHAVFAFSAVMSVLVLLGIRPLLPSSVGDRRPVDLPGAAMVTAGLLAGIFAVTRAGEVGLSDTGTIVSALLALLLLAGFVAWERRAPEPLFSVGILRSRPVRAATLAGALFFFALNGVLFFAPLYMQGMLGYTPLQSGLAVLPMSLLVAVFSNVAGRLLSRFGQRRVLVAGLVLLAAGVALWLRTPLDGDYLTHILPGVAVMAIGQGLAYTALTAASLTGVPGARHGVAGAFNITAQQVGSSVGIAALVAFASALSGSGEQADRLSTYHAVYLVISCVVIVGALVTAALFGRRADDRAPEVGTPVTG
ncbi:MFS transporter [Amycolatopsis thailandensis]|uniref:MFS transporter n=1 Tax=Amycolatopsis thailandensis TaxID=589330 RepID=UPI00142D6CB1|nr:MFS transporter [Amycolatopsis thailandensis]